MKIVIAGAGDVGTHLAKMLSKDRHTIILLDEQAEKIKTLEANYDILSVVGSPTSLKDLVEAQVPSADLFVGVTPSESTNITACMLATKLGAIKTLARIDNQEYLMPKNKEFFKSMGIDDLIYPEMLAAKEIVNSLKKSWVRQYVELSDGALVVVATKMRSNSPLCNIPLSQAFATNGNIRIVAIKRGDTTIVPSGKNQVMEDDIVYFITTREGVEDVRIQSGKENYDISNIMFLGASRICIKTIQELPKSKDIKVIEQDLDKTYRIIENTDNVLVIQGDGRDISLLQQEDISSFDAFVALSGNAETNILSCLAAKGMGVNRTIAEVENMDYIDMAEKLDIGAIINKKLIAASYIYQMILGGDASVKFLTLADIDIVELTAENNSYVTKGPLSSLSFPKNTIIGGVVRNGVGEVAVGKTQIQAGDTVIVFCNRNSLVDIEKLFK
ncbi:MAG: Trk system potassium transporter TrkA [Paludibacteraceae bacterium]|nr:Trk system potassium transporter TrkA [Paludibacteraceae bacterium]